jgi:hypothetical protein
MIKNFFMLMLILPLFPFPAGAEYYKYVDEDGNVTFTDNLNKIPEEKRSNANVFKPEQSNPRLPPGASANSPQMGDEEAARRLMEMMKKDFGAKGVCPAETEDEAGRAIQNTWTKMTRAVIAGDLEATLTYFTIFSRDEYRRRLSGYDKEKLKAIFGSYDSLDIGKFEGRQVECGAIRHEKTGTYSYPIQFNKDLDCVWRIYGF